MAEIPDIHEYPLLVEHFNLIQKIQFEEKNKEEIKRLCYRMIEILPECKKQAQMFSERKQLAMKEWHVRLGENYPPEYCIGPNTFIRRHEEQSYTHNLLPEGAEKPAVWGYELISRAFM